MRQKINKIFDSMGNVFLNDKYDLSYVAESRDWVIGQLGREITSNLNSLKMIKSRMTLSSFGLRNKIVHLGSPHIFLKDNGVCHIDKTNKYVLSWFHIVPGNRRNKNIIEGQKHLSFIHTACYSTKKELVNLGVKENKIIVIPLGINLSLFKPSLNKGLDLPKDKIIIGSFQKDGIGWKEGLEPKMVKGPDIFVKVVSELNKIHPVFVLLVGPSRGYVTKELGKRGIPYKSIGFLRDFRDIVQYYQALDLYLITSRIEGGPRAILESWATKVPLVSTKVGMVPDIAENGLNALLTEVEDVGEIISKAKMIIENKNLRESLINNGFEAVQNYSLEKTTKRFFNEIYSKLL